MRLLPRLQGDIGPLAYAVAAPALLLSQHAGVALVYAAAGLRLRADLEFWLLPLRALARLPDLSAAASAAAFAAGLAVTWTLAVLSFRRAWHANRGFALAALSVAPGFQIAAVAALAAMPSRPREEEPSFATAAGVAPVLQGLLAGVGLVVFGVVVSALIFGAYGWGLFVLTPFAVGFATAYLANRRGPIGSHRTLYLALAAAGLGCLALVMLALEGLICILMAAPLGAAATAVGALIGRAAAQSRDDGQPLRCLAALPLVFALDAAMPPAAAFETRESILVAAPPEQVWQALVSGEEIAPEPGLVFRLGLAYPVRAALAGEGVGARRSGRFSTGTAHETVTEWVPGRRLAFRIESQPPAMRELSPYAQVHAPHLVGYFETVSTRFDLTPLAGGGTRLTARSSHVLRLDPVSYWEPMARWAAQQNMRRVLRHMRARSEHERVAAGL